MQPSAIWKVRLDRGPEARAAARAAPAAAARASEERPEQVAPEDVAERAEDVLVRAEAAAALHGRVAVAVVDRPLLEVGEDLVGLRGLLELLLGRLVAGVLVGVVLQRQLAVGRLDVVGRRGAGDAEDLVGVALVGHGLRHATRAVPRFAKVAAGREWGGEGEGGSGRGRAGPTYP